MAGISVEMEAASLPRLAHSAESLFLLCIPLFLHKFIFNTNRWIGAGWLLSILKKEKKLAMFISFYIATETPSLSLFIIAILLYIFSNYFRIDTPYFYRNGF